MKHNLKIANVMCLITIIIMCTSCNQEVISTNTVISSTQEEVVETTTNEMMSETISTNQTTTHKSALSTSTSDEDYQMLGNLAGNLFYSGISVQYNNEIYYNGTDGKLYRMNIDGSNSSILAEFNLYNLQVFDDWIYGSVFPKTESGEYADKYSAYMRININSGETETIYEGSFYFGYMYRDDLYYSIHDKIYSYDIENQMATELCQDTREYEIYSFFIYDELLFFNNTKCNKLTGEVEQYNLGTGSSFVSNDRVLYSDSTGVYSNNVKNDDKQMISNIPSNQFIVDGDYVFIADKDGGLYRASVLDGQTDCIYENKILRFNLAGEWLFFEETDDMGGSRIYRMRLDGRSKTEI